MGITIGKVADTEEKVRKVKRLLYTWRDCYARNMREIRATDLVEHTIDLKPNARPVYAKIPSYNHKEREFAAKIFPEMEAAGIIIRGASDWGAKCKFPPKKPGSSDFRVVHNFMPVNAETIKPAYPTHSIDEVVDTIIRPKFGVFFGNDASNGYWAIPMKKGHEYKAGIVTPHGQYLYLRMGQGLKGAAHTYAQYTDLTFGPLPATKDEKAYETLIGDHGEVAFSPFVDDHIGSATCFDAMFDFLHTRYFPRCVFGPIYLSPKKSHVFMDQLDFIGFTGDASGIRPSRYHRDRVMNRPTPTTREEVEAFLWLTPFLRIFIPGGAEHAIIMKKRLSWQTTSCPYGKDGSKPGRSCGDLSRKLLSNTLRKLYLTMQWAGPIGTSNTT